MSYDDSPTKNERPRRDSQPALAPTPALIDVLERVYNQLLRNEEIQARNEAIQTKLLERLSEPQRISVAPPPPERRGALYYLNVAVAAAIGTGLVLVACR